MRRVLIAILSAAVLISTPEIAAAQQKPTQKPPAPPATRKPPPKTPTGVRLYGLVDVDFMAATQTFDATLGSSTLIGFGGGADITNVWGGLFLRAALSHVGKSGERVAVAGDEIFPLGIGLKLSMTPIEFGAGWRAPVGKRKRANAYGGGGLLLVRYSETGDFAAADDDTNESFPGSFFVGGVDFLIGKVFNVGFEGQYRIVKNALGDGGVSQIFGEDDLGGFTIRAMFGIRK